MVAPSDVRRIACALPHVEDGSNDASLAFSVAGGKGFAWSWKARTAAKAPRIPRLDVLAIRCIPEEKDFLLGLDAAKFFTEPHYNGFPAVLVRLDQVDEAELAGLLRAAWLSVAPKRLQKALIPAEAGTPP